MCIRVDVSQYKLFLVCAEIIAIELRNDPDIVGVIIEDLEYLLNQYADDVTASLDFKENSIRATFEKLEWFRRNTGFTLSYEKTTIFRMGSLQGSDASLYTQSQVAWTDEPVNVLGISVGYGNIADLNYQNLYEKSSQVLQLWRHRGLSLAGKVLIINVLISSLFIYKMCVLPRIPTQLISKLSNLFNIFLWDGKKPKIPLRVLQGDRKSGGMKLVNLRKRDMAVKVTWFNILRTDDKTAKLAYYFICPLLGERIWECNFHPADVNDIIQPSSNSFWYDVLQAWASLHYCPEVGKSNQYYLV